MTHRALLKNELLKHSIVDLRVSVLNWFRLKILNFLNLLFFAYV